MNQNLQKLKIGSASPDFEFTLTRGNTISLSNLAEKGPVILNFIKGPWCQQCANYMRSLRRWQSSLEKKNVTLLVISSQSVETLREWAKSNSVEFLLGSAVEASATFAKFGLTLDTPTGFTKPATYLIETDMTVRLVWDDQPDLQADSSTTPAVTGNKAA